jgi:hypothetical protein
MTAAALRGLRAATFLALGFLRWEAGMTSRASAEDPWMTLPLPGPMPRQRRRAVYAPVNGIDMYYRRLRRRRSGDPAAWRLGECRYWANQVPELAKSHKVIVADSRGHGRSTRTADPYS